MLPAKITSGQHILSARLGTKAEIKALYRQLPMISKTELQCVGDAHRASFLFCVEQMEQTEQTYGSKGYGLLQSRQMQR